MSYAILQKLCICLIVSLTKVGSHRPKYRDDYTYEKAFHTFYKIHPEAMEWAKARSRCEAEGSELMVPTSLDEADSMPLLTGHISNHFAGVFVGIHDLYSEKSFVTLNGSTIVNTILDLLWENKEPRPNGGRCVAMRRTGKLYLQPCTDQLPFICKKKASKIIYYKECETYESKWQIGLNGKCYIAHQEPQTWFDAFSTCIAAGGNLAVLRNRAEADHIRDLFKLIKEQRVPDNDFAFLGFNDLLQRHHYRTVHGERLDAVGFTNWDLQCQPEDSYNVTAKRCGGVRRSGLLSTGRCNTPSVFFCEKKISNDSNSNTTEENKNENKDNSKIKNDGGNINKKDEKFESEKLDENTGKKEDKNENDTDKTR